MNHKNTYKLVIYAISLTIAACGNSSNFINGNNVAYLPQGNYYTEVSDITSSSPDKLSICYQSFSYPKVIEINNKGQLCANESCGITINLAEANQGLCAVQASETALGYLYETIDFCTYADNVFSGLAQNEYPQRNLVCTATLIMYPAANQPSSKQ